MISNKIAKGFENPALKHGSACRASVPTQSSVLSPQHSKGFSLVEMIVVMVITGILGGMVAMFIRAPVQSYMDSSRRAEMTDIADTALRRIARDVRTALPGSIRLATGAACPGGSGTCDFLEFLPTKGSGRYRTNAIGGAGSCGGGDEWLFDGADTCFEILGTMPPMAAGDSVVVFNQAGDPNCDAYLAAAQNRAARAANTATTVTLGAALSSTCDFGTTRFYVISTPASYVCNTTAGTLTRYAGYARTDAQPTSALTGGNLLASNVSVCSFAHNQPMDLLTMRLGITESDETVSLYHAVHVSNASSN